MEQPEHTLVPLAPSVRQMSDSALERALEELVMRAIVTGPDAPSRDTAEKHIGVLYLEQATRRKAREVRTFP
jgi:hypothetical protein